MKAATPQSGEFDVALARYLERRRKGEAVEHEGEQADRAYGARWRGAVEVLDLLEAALPTAVATASNPRGGAPTPPPPLSRWNRIAASLRRIFSR